MNSGVSNCIEVHKFWHYLTDLGTNISDRERIFFRPNFIDFDSYSNRIELVSNRMNTAVTYQIQLVICTLDLPGTNTRGYFSPQLVRNDVL
jgi:hypothetical protein